MGLCKVQYGVQKFSIKWFPLSSRVYAYSKVKKEEIEAAGAQEVSILLPGSPQSLASTIFMPHTVVFIYNAFST